MKKKRKRKSYTVMFVPDDNGRTFYIRINRYIIYSLFFFLVIFVLGIGALLMRSGEIGAKLQLTYSLLNENKRLINENEKLRSITQKLESIEHTSTYLQRLATAVGEEALSATVSKANHTKEKMFSEDSLDAFIDDLRTEESDIYKQLKVSSASRKELSLSIPNISPVDGWITKRVIKDPDKPYNNHLGLDFAAKEGTPIRTTAPGIVHDVSNDTYFGLSVTVKHKFGYITRYGHCLQTLVSKGDVVKRGQTIALIGNTGRSTAPHVHYEILKDGKNVDPIEYVFKRL